MSYPHCPDQCSSQSGVCVCGAPPSEKLPCPLGCHGEFQGNSSDGITVCVPSKGSQNTSQQCLSVSHADHGGCKELATRFLSMLPVSVYPVTIDTHGTILFSEPLPSTVGGKPMLGHFVGKKTLSICDIASSAKKIFPNWDVSSLGKCCETPQTATKLPRVPNRGGGVYSTAARNNATHNNTVHNTAARNNATQHNTAASNFCPTGGCLDPATRAILEQKGRIMAAAKNAAQKDRLLGNNCRPPTPPLSAQVCKNSAPKVCTASHKDKTCVPPADQKCVEIPRHDSATSLSATQQPIKGFEGPVANYRPAASSGTLGGSIDQMQCASRCETLDACKGFTVDFQEGPNNPRCWLFTNTPERLLPTTYDAQTYRKTAPFHAALKGLHTARTSLDRSTSWDAALEKSSGKFAQSAQSAQQPEEIFARSSKEEELFGRMSLRIPFGLQCTPTASGSNSFEQDVQVAHQGRKFKASHCESVYGVTPSVCSGVFQHPDQAAFQPAILASLGKGGWATALTNASTTRDRYTAVHRNLLGPVAHSTYGKVSHAASMGDKTAQALKQSIEKITDQHMTNSLADRLYVHVNAGKPAEVAVADALTETFGCEPSTWANSFVGTWLRTLEATIQKLFSKKKPLSLRDAKRLCGFRPESGICTHMCCPECKSICKNETRMISPAKLQYCEATEGMTPARCSKLFASGMCDKDKFALCKNCAAGGTAACCTECREFCARHTPVDGGKPTPYCASLDAVAGGQRVPPHAGCNRK